MFKCAYVHVCKFESMQMCKCVNVQVCKCARMKMCKYANVQVCKCASVHVCKYASVIVCKCASVSASTKFECVFFSVSMPLLNELQLKQKKNDCLTKPFLSFRSSKVK